MTATAPRKSKTAHSAPPSALEAAYATLRGAWRRDGGLDYDARMDALDRLAGSLKRHQVDLEAAVDADFGGRSPHETAMFETYMVLNAIKYLRKHLKGWMTPEARHVDLIFKPARNVVRYQPLGVVGVIAPWNYPVQLALVPVATAIAAGNRVALKPSEYTPRTAEALTTLLAEALSPEIAQVVTGGPEVGKAFSEIPFDHLLFTGSTEVGRHVMRAAAANLTPVTLELGGKSPAIIHRSYDMAAAAERIAVGKLANAGQTCIAPDYVLCPEDRVERFAELFREAAAKLYPTLADNADYTAVINERHYDRLIGLRDGAVKAGARVVEVNPAGEDFPADGKKIAPTVVLDVTEDMPIMQEEIFGPLLPVIPYRDLHEAIDYVNDHPRPLALYYFDRDDARVEEVLSRTISGGACVNDTLLHVGQDDLPFGGVGASGMGAYHGREGFETFSHKRAVFQQARINGAGLLKPPYGKAIDVLLRLLTGRK